ECCYGYSCECGRPGAPTRGRVLWVSSRSRPRAGSGFIMTHTVCQPCYDCKYTDCVAVCPVECFWQDDTMLYIDPADCIDCEACVPECPVEAIFWWDYAHPHVPPAWEHFIQVNSERAAALKASGEGH